jgi:NAD(P)-dependent dehydrogenase (short-subunit alcohol dehydrogenase family)
MKPRTRQRSAGDWPARGDVQADLSRPADCATLVATVAEKLGRLDILINMASVYHQRSFDELTVDDWNAAMDVDLRAAFLCAHFAAPHMRRQGGGRIINFGDWVARSGRPATAGSCRTTSQRQASLR